MTCVVTGVLCATACSKSGKSGEPQNISVKASFPEYDGDYDGAKAVAFKFPDGTLLEVKAARNCPAFDCPVGKSWSSGWEKTACPQGFILTLGVNNPKVGTHKVRPGLLGVAQSSTNSLGDADVELSEISATQVTGKVNLPDTVGVHAIGPFTAKVCAPSN